MNFLAEIQAFYIWLETNELNASAISLWYALMQTSNNAGWKNPFTVAISTLEQRAGLHRDAVYRARNRLKQCGLVTFKERGSNRATEYYLVSIYATQHAIQSATQTAMHTTTHTATQSAIQTATIPKQNQTKPKDVTPITPIGFDAFWAAYPNKKGKDAAAKAFAKRKPDQAMLDTMLMAIDRQKASPQWQRENGRFIPHPATWLNQGRWMDEDTENPQEDKFANLRRLYMEVKPGDD